MTATDPARPGEGAAELRRGAMRLARRLLAERPPAGLSPNKLGVLGHLYRHGPTTPGGLAAAEHQRPQSLTRAFAELERAGLVSRTRSERDRRQQVLALTQAGRRALARGVGGLDAWLGAALAALTETERQVLGLAAALMERIAETPAAPRAEDGPRASTHAERSAFRSRGGPGQQSGRSRGKAPAASPLEGGGTTPEMPGSSRSGPPRARRQEW